MNPSPTIRDHDPRAPAPGPAAPTILESPDPAARASASASAVTILEGPRTPTGFPRPLTARAQAAAATTSAELVLTPGATFREWKLTRPIQAASAEADLWILAHHQTGEPAVLKLFRYGISPKTEIQEAVRRLKFSSVVTVFATGEVEGRQFEIQEFIPGGSLAQFFPAGPAPADALHTVLAELVDSLADVHAADIIHRDLKPANILIRSRDPLDLVLADFGISSLSDLSLHLSNANRTAAYAAPEAMTGVVARASDWWSVGVILFELLTGRHPFAGLDERTVNFVLVTRGIEVPASLPDDWALLIRGLLTRDHQKRWGLAQVRAWLAGERDLAVYYGLEAGVEVTPPREPYKFAGREFRDPASLAIALVDHWDDAVRRLTRGSLTDWARQSLRDTTLAARLEAITADTLLDSDQQLAAALLALDPALPLVLRGTVITPEWLGANATVQHAPVIPPPSPGPAPAAAGGADFDIELLRRVIAVARTEKQTSPTHLERRLGIAPERAERILDELARRHLVSPRGKVLARDVLIGPDEGLSVAVGVLESSLPRWLEELRGDHWLTQAAARHRDTWAFFYSAQLPVNRNLADQLILSPHDGAVWPLVGERRRQFARSRHPGLHALLTGSETLTWPGAVALVAAEPADFQTHDQVMLADAHAWLERLPIRYDRALAERLMLARDWNALLDDWRARRERFVAATPPAIAAILKKDEPEYLEAIALVTADAGHFESARQQWLAEAARWSIRLARVRRELLEPPPPWFTAKLPALSAAHARGTARIRAVRAEFDAFMAGAHALFHRVEPTADDMAAAHTADCRESELLVAMLKLEEDLTTAFTRTRRRTLLLLGALLLIAGTAVVAWHISTS